MKLRITARTPGPYQIYGDLIATTYSIDLEDDLGAPFHSLVITASASLGGRTMVKVFRELTKTVTDRADKALDAFLRANNASLLPEVM